MWEFLSWKVMNANCFDLLAARAFSLNFPLIWCVSKEFCLSFLGAAQAKIKRNIKKLFSLAARPSLALFLDAARDPFMFMNALRRKPFEIRDKSMRDQHQLILQCAIWRSKWWIIPAIFVTFGKTFYNCAQWEIVAIRWYF